MFGTCCFQCTSNKADIDFISTAVNVHRARLGALFHRPHRCDYACEVGPARQHDLQHWAGWKRLRVSSLLQGGDGGWMSRHALLEWLAPSCLDGFVSIGTRPCCRGQTRPDGNETERAGQETRRREEQPGTFRKLSAIDQTAIPFGLHSSTHCMLWAGGTFRTARE